MNSVNTVHSDLARPKIQVLGATDGTGRLIVKQALDVSRQAVSTTGCISPDVNECQSMWTQ
jgi:hypothetical protein